MKGNGPYVYAFDVEMFDEIISRMCFTTKFSPVSMNPCQVPETNCLVYQNDTVHIQMNQPNDDWYVTQNYSWHLVNTNFSADQQSFTDILQMIRSPRHVLEVGNRGLELLLKAGFGFDFCREFLPSHDIPVSPVPNVETTLARVTCRWIWNIHSSRQLFLNRLRILQSVWNQQFLKCPNKTNRMLRASWKMSKLVEVCFCANANTSIHGFLILSFENWGFWSGCNIACI